MVRQWSDSGPTVVRQWSDRGPTVRQSDSPTVPTAPTALKAPTTDTPLNSYDSSDSSDNSPPTALRPSPSTALRQPSDRLRDSSDSSDKQGSNSFGKANRYTWHCLTRSATRRRSIEPHHDLQLYQLMTRITGAAARVSSNLSSQLRISQSHGVALHTISPPVYTHLGDPDV